jgi:hypothetical protein
MEELHFISAAFLVISFPSMLSMAFSLPAHQKKGGKEENREEKKMPATI